MKRIGKLKGFTLIEILVVLAIVALLSAILFAVFSRVRESGRNTVCQSNLKQIGLALQQYVQDSNGHYPPYEKGTIMLPYMKVADQNLLFDCPSDPHFGDRSESYKYNIEKLVTHVTASGIGKHESRFSDPASVWLETDWPSMSSQSQIDYYQAYMADVSPKVGSPCTFVTWHSGGANFSFLDGHVKWLKPEAACAIDNAG